MIVRFAALCCLILCSAVCADTTSDKRVLSQQLTKLLRVEEAFKGYVEGCSSATMAADAAAVSYREHPETFGGMSPDSVYWPEVEKIYLRYQTAVCSDVTVESITTFSSKQYAAQMSESDLRAAIKFYSTPVGQLIVQSELRINSALQDQARETMRAARVNAEDQYQRDISVLIKKFQHDPSASFGSTQSKRP